MSFVLISSLSEEDIYNVQLKIHQFTKQAVWFNLSNPFASSLYDYIHLKSG